MPKRIELCIIDPQIDFCDPKGSLYVAGANEDMNRLAKFVKKFGRKLQNIRVTLDSHHDLHIAHPCFWVDANGKNPPPFTIINPEDVEKGKWTPAMPSKSICNIALNYVRDLAAKGKYALCIWPPHCIIGSAGQAIYPPLHEELRAWARDNFQVIQTKTKGSNPYCEHYSAIKAEVEDPNDPYTQLDGEFIESLIKADEILISGEALSHCVANTFRDVADEFKNDELVKNLILLKDASSNVGGFESLGEKFVKDLSARGMRITTTTDYML